LKPNSHCDVGNKQQQTSRYINHKPSIYI
jgi:hypothetical protein